MLLVPSDSSFNKKNSQCHYPIVTTRLLITAGDFFPSLSPTIKSMTDVKLMLGNTLPQYFLKSHCGWAVHRNNHILRVISICQQVITYQHCCFLFPRLLSNLQLKTSHNTGSWLATLQYGWSMQTFGMGNTTHYTWRQRNASGELLKNKDALPRSTIKAQCSLVCLHCRKDRV